WYVKNGILFGTYTTSSWLGMNLRSVTIKSGGAAQVADLVRGGKLTPIAELNGFSPVDQYEPRFVHVSPTGIPALDERTKANGEVNYNNLVYVSVSKRYLHDDLAYIRAEPGAYARHAAEAASAWFVPAGVSPPISSEAHIASYLQVFDRAVLWQPTSPNRFAVLHWVLGDGPTMTQLSYLMLIVMALAVAGTPAVVWRRRDDPALAGTLAFLWLTLVYGFLTTSLIDLAENPRFSFELGPLPLVTAAAVLASLLTSRRTAGPAR
ncbi:MAG TPA: hypothetical protein VG476_07505, partial [Acidimicrobiales bacterium]|nr:hypothetical protein [Acidimicrobiales bacterium]